MADTGATLPGTGTAEDRDSKVTWTTPGNITTEADYASQAPDKNDYGDWLRASNFGFSVPSEATIDGIKVQINRMCHNYTDSLQDSSLRLVDGSGNNVGDDKASATYYPTTATTAEYGGSSDTWNASPTPTMVNDSDFGVRLSVYNATSTIRQVYVYWIEITVYYTEGGVTHEASAFFMVM